MNASKIPNKDHIKISLELYSALFDKILDLKNVTEFCEWYCTLHFYGM